MTASRPTQTRIRGGVSDTDVNELAVIPCGRAPPTVTTVTPVAKEPSTRRSRAVSVMSPDALDWVPISHLPVARCTRIFLVYGSRARTSDSGTRVGLVRWLGPRMH